MTRETHVRISRIAAAAALMFATASASAATGVSRWVAAVAADGSRDSNWFNPANWSTGQVPGADSDVELAGTDYVQIDQALNPAGGKVVFQDLHVRDAATFEVIGGAVVETRDQTQADHGLIVFRGSGDIGGSLTAGEISRPPPTDGSSECTTDRNGVTVCTVPGDGGNGGGGVFLNPNQKSKRIIVLQSSATVDVGLGGTEPASISIDASGTVKLLAGRGYYSTIATGTATLSGELRLTTYYDFRPQPGDRYQIMTIEGTRSGEFIGVPEGGYVACTEDYVGMRLSYRGGDGNDLVLSAERTDPGVCLLLPAVQRVREAAAHTAQLRRQAAGDLLDSGSSGDGTETKLPSPTTPISGPKPPKK